VAVWFSYKEGMAMSKFRLSLRLAVVILGIVCLMDIDRADAAPGDITTVVGGGASDGIPAIQAHLAGAWGIKVNSAGDIAIADWRGSRVYKVSAATGIISHVAGTGMNARSIGWSGLDGPATKMVIDAPVWVEIDGSGNVYFQYEGKILKTTPAGAVTTVVGSGGALHTLDSEGNIYYRSGQGINVMNPAIGEVSSVVGGAKVNGPSDLTFDSAGNLYYVNQWEHQVYRISPSGKVTLVAGDGHYANNKGDGRFAGDGGPATAASLNRPRSIALDAAGNVYIVDQDNQRVRKVDGATGIITTIAGTGEAAFSGDGGPATKASLNRPQGIFVDGLKNIYIADQNNYRVRKVDAVTGVITTVAGTGVKGCDGEDKLAVNTDLWDPQDVFVDGTGNLYIAECNEIRKVDPKTGIMTSVAGRDQGFDFSGDGGPATQASFKTPGSVWIDKAGNIYILDANNFRVRKVDAGTGIITTVAGNGKQDFSGDGGPATQASIGRAASLAVDESGNIFIADQVNHRIRKVDTATGRISTFLGGGPANGALAAVARFSNMQDMFVDSRKNVYIVDGAENRVWKADAATGLLAIVAGNGKAGYSGDGGLATEASLNSPRGVAVDNDGNVYIGDTFNNRVRKVDASGRITTFAGGHPTSGERATLRPVSADGGPATAAMLIAPHGVDIDGAGNVYISDRENQRIRKVAPSGTITTVAGGGLRDGGPAFDAGLSGWYSGLFIDRSGNLYIGDANNSRIRKVEAQTGTIRTVAGNGLPESEPSPDGGLATQTAISPGGVFVTPDGALYFPGSGRLRKVDVAGRVTTVAGGGKLTGAGILVKDAFIGGAPQAVVDGSGAFFANAGTRVQKVDGSGLVTVVAGTGEAGFSGDGGPATQAKFDGITDIFIDSRGDLYLADRVNQRVRKVDGNTGIVTTVAGNGKAGFSGDGGPAVNAQLSNPYGVFVDDAGNVFIADNVNNRVRKVDGKTGIITTVAGNGSQFHNGDGGPATKAAVWVPTKVFGDASGNLYIGLYADRRIAKVEGIAAPTTVGTGVFNGPTFPSLAETQAGTNVPVNSADPISGVAVALTFSSVTGAGATALTTTTTGPPAPKGFQLGNPPIYLDLNTSAKFTGSVALSLDYSSIRVVNEDSLKLFHYENGAWVDVTTSLDTAKNTIYGRVTSFSLFALAEPEVKASKNLAVVAATVTNNGVPVPGVEVAFSRSISGVAHEYAWKGITDAEGKVEIRIVASEQRFWRVGATGMYVARATNPTTGAVTGQWGSIPINGNQKATLLLPVGGQARVVSVTSLSAPTASALTGNYPNPFNPATQIAYELPEAGEVRLTIYNVLGQQVRALVQGRQEAGFYRVTWDGRDAAGRPVSSGIYLYRLEAGGFTETRRMLLLK
jgi:hypothetical protein